MPMTLRQNSRLLRYLLIALAGLVPGLVTFILLSGYFQVDITRFMPVGWNDQTYYWHQILTFQQAGFQGGFYVVNEVLPPVELFHFGASGFLYPTLYGLVARVVGWQYNTGIFLNMAVIALATWVCLLWSRFDWRQILFAILILLFVGPVLLFIPTISEESFHQAAALILGWVFLALLQGRQPRTRLFPWLILILLIVVSLVRFSWIYLLLPFWLLIGKQRTLRMKVAIVLGAGVLMVVILAVFQVTSAPGNNSVFRRIADVATSPLEGMSALLALTWENLQQLFRVENMFAPTPEIIQSLQYMGLLVTVAAGGLLVGRPQPDKRSAVPSIGRAEIMFHVYNLGVMVVTALVFYLPEGYYRVFAPHLLLSLVILIGYRRFRLVGMVVFIGIVSMGAFLEEYQRFRIPAFTFSEHAPTEAFQAVFLENMVYDADAANPWCNTLLMPRALLNTPYPAAFIPGGIGVSFYFAPDAMHYPLQSRYLLLTERAYADLSHRVHVTFLAETPAGTLYRNLDAPCGPNQQGE